MNVDVQLEGEERPRRFSVQRKGDALVLRELPAPGESGRKAIDSSEAPEILVDLRAPSRGVYSLIVDGDSWEIHVDEDARDEEQLVVHVAGRALSMRAADARKRRVTRSGGGPDGLVRINAPMPGRVVKVLAPEGTEVKRGAGIIVLEAMKMENELKAPRDGTVSKIAVQEGQGVEGGALLATIE